jgi:hypothetical protein
MLALWWQAMIIFFDSNYKVNSIDSNAIGPSTLHISRSMLIVSITIIGSILGSLLVGITLVDGISLVFLRSIYVIEAFCWIYYLHACFCSRNALIILQEPSALHIFFKQVPSKPFSSSKYFWIIFLFFVTLLCS